MNTQLIIDYLSSLSANNNREWYHANKETYKKANAEFESFLQALILEIGKFDSSVLHNSPKDLTFRMVRDTRFSHDKSPYNPAFRAHIASKGKLPVPVGYYLMIKPENQSFLGGGLMRQGWYGILSRKTEWNGKELSAGRILKNTLP